MGGNSLVEHYRMNFILMKDHGYSLSELEQMYPFERELYIEMLLEYMDQQNEGMPDG